VIATDGGGGAGWDGRFVSALPTPLTPDACRCADRATERILLFLGVVDDEPLPRIGRFDRDEGDRPADVPLPAAAG
jgi:hypothetical protein